jgi:hypothetical protein
MRESALALAELFPARVMDLRKVFGGPEASEEALFASTLSVTR